MNRNPFPMLLSLTSMVGASPVAIASADTLKSYPTNVNCQLSLDKHSSSSLISIEDVARSCNEFKVQDELEFNLVKGACVLSGTLSGLIYGYSEGLCKSENATALCRVQVQDTEIEEVTWYFEPDSSQHEKLFREDKFKASCAKLGGKFEPLGF